MEILDGVKLGEQVVLTDVDNLAEGMKVTVAGNEKNAAGDRDDKGARASGAQARTGAE